MANLNLNQDVAKDKENRRVLVLKSNLIQAAGMHRYGSLININPSEPVLRKK